MLPMKQTSYRSAARGPESLNKLSLSDRCSPNIGSDRLILPLVLLVNMAHCFDTFNAVQCNKRD